MGFDIVLACLKLLCLPRDASVPSVLLRIQTYVCRLEAKMMKDELLPPGLLQRRKLSRRICHSRSIADGAKHEKHACREKESASAINFSLFFAVCL